MNLTLCLTICLLLLIPIIIAVLSDNYDNLFGLFLMLNTMWYMFGMVMFGMSFDASRDGYTVETVKIQNVVDVPFHSLHIILENGQHFESTDRKYDFIKNMKEIVLHTHHKNMYGFRSDVRDNIDFEETFKLYLKEQKQ